MSKEKTDNIDYAEVAAKSQKQISVAEFFEKNRHLLGFDNPTRGLLTAVKEAVDNSLDACEDANILPEIYIEIIEMDDSRYRVIVEDNGPGIVKEQVSSIFGKLLYGSKFHKMKQSRGQQGIGISAAILYSQLTTGRDAKIISKTKSKDKALKLKLHIDTKTNKPVISSERELSWNKEHGTSIELELEANYRKGKQSVDEYLREVAIVNPHATITYVNPYAEQMIYTRAVNELPEKPKEIKPHPHGIEFGKLISMLQVTNKRTLRSFLIDEFSRVGSNTAKDIIDSSGLESDFKPNELKRVAMDRLYKAMNKVDVSTPRTDCLSPIGEDKILKGIKKETEAEFYHTVTRTPTVYRGNPFLVEVGLAYGGDLESEGSIDIMRFANRVPLLYQHGACAITKAVKQVNWKRYGLKQSGNNMPIGPMNVVAHIASVWTPYTSEAKEAIAHYDGIIKELKLALQEAGRKLKRYLSKKRSVQKEMKKRKFIEQYIPHISSSIKNILDFGSNEELTIEENLKEILEKNRGA